MLPNDGIVYPVGSRQLSIFPFSLRFFTNDEKFCQNVKEREDHGTNDNFDDRYPYDVTCLSLFQSEQFATRCYSFIQNGTAERKLNTAPFLRHRPAKDRIFYLNFTEISDIGEIVGWQRNGGAKAIDTGAKQNPNNQDNIRQKRVSV